jgi:type I restriction enzyme S subunit
MNDRRALPEGWMIAEFGVIFTFENKSKHTASEGKEKGDFKFFTSSNFQSKFVDSFHLDGEFLIFGTGGNASIHYSNEKFSTSTDCLIAKTNNTSILTKYVYYYLAANMYLLVAGFRGAGLKHISKSYIQEIKIPYSKNKEIQNKIVTILDKAEETKRLRAQADELTDRLLQSVFMEMFGDPVKNTKGWEIMELDAICSEIYRYPTFYGFEYSKIGVPVVRIKNIFSDGSLDPDVSNYVFIEPKLNKNFPRTILEFNDIVMAVRGDGSTVKRIGIVNTINLVGANISPNLIRFKANKVILNPLYLFKLMTSDSGQKLLEKCVTRTAKKTITAREIKEIRIPIPPLPLQQEFARIVEKVESMRQSQKQSKQQIEDLFSALMQKAFRGELDKSR